MSQRIGDESISDELHTAQQWMKDEIIDRLEYFVAPKITLARFGKVSPNEIEILEDAGKIVHNQLVKALTIRKNLFHLRNSWLKLTGSRSRWFNRRRKRSQKHALIKKLQIERDGLLEIIVLLDSIRDILHKADSKSNDKEVKEYLRLALKELNNLDRELNSIADKLTGVSRQMENHEI